MEMTNELNKFLSYIHMGNSVYRIYYNESNKFHDEKLEKLFTEIMEVFKKHEESITSLIESFNEEATSSLTAAGILGVYKEKMKIFDEPLDICVAALKATNMGTISALKFLNNNKKLHDDVKHEIYEVISDYGLIENKIINYTLENL
jgi:septum formation topological specificity factor MinE